MNPIKKNLSELFFSIPDEFESKYKKYLNELWFSRLNVAYLFCIVLLPFAFVFDILIFPELWQELLKIRLIATLICIALFIISNKTFLKKYPESMCHLLNIVIASSIALLTYLTGSHTSPYYAGLILVFIGIAMIVPWGIKGAFTAGSTILFIHLFINVVIDLLNKKVIIWPSFWVSIYFLTFALIMVIISSGITETNRRKIFAVSEREKIKNKKLEESRKKIDELSKTKSHFITNITHELKTPLSIIIGNIEIIQEKTSEFGEAVKKQLQIVKTSAFQLSNHVDRIISISKVDDPKVKLSLNNYNYAGIVRNIFAIFTSRAAEEKKQYELNLINDSLIANIDVVRIEEVLNNLIQNAFKFTQAGDSIKITVSSDDHNINTEVFNSGVRIPRSHMKKIFTRLYQADDALSKRFDGIGVGLYLVKRNIELHSGTITANSNKKYGTSFKFTLPLYIDQNVSIENPVFKKDDRRKGKRRDLDKSGDVSGRRENDRAMKFELQQRLNLDDLLNITHIEDILGYEDVNPEYPSVLIVEDNPGMLKVTVDALHEEYNLHIAQNGVEALEKLNKFGDQISLILSDVLMPEMNGFDLCEKVMSEEKWKHIPFIFNSALFEEKDQIKGFDLGATDYLVKPYNIRILKEKVSHWIARRQYEILLQDISASLEFKSKEILKIKDFVIHEIRNPLQIISSADFFLQKLMDSNPIISAKNELKLNEILKMLKHGFNSIESVLNTSDFLVEDELASKNIEPVEFLFDEALVQSKHLLDNISIKTDFSSTKGKSVFCNKKMLTQVFVNLIRNAVEAIKKTGPANEGTIDIYSKTGKNNFIIINIQDNGIGIPENIQKKLFQFRFTTKKDGAGIGLHLSKMILGIHHGKIGVDSKEGAGTTFSVYLPVHNSRNKKI